MARIFVAGHNGMVGSAICRSLVRNSANKILTAGRTDLDLRDQSEVPHSWPTIKLMKYI